MKNKRVPLGLLLLILLLQASILVGQQDSDIVLALDVQTQPMSEEAFKSSLKSVIENTEVVEVFHFAIDEKGKTIKADSSENKLLGFKVKKELPRLVSADAQKIKSIINKEANYLVSDLVPKCGWYPDIAFKFTWGEQSMLALIMAIPECNVAKFYWSNGEWAIKEITPARTEIIAFAKKIFLREYYDVPSVIEVNIAQRSTDTIVSNDANNQNSVIDSIEDKKEEQGESGSQFHIIRKGETWRKIAKKHSMKTKKLKRLNKKIKWGVGERLVIREGK